MVRLCLRPDFHVTAGLDAKRPTELVVDLEGDCYQSGSDGLRSLVATMLFYSLLSELGGRPNTSENSHSYQRGFDGDRSRSGSTQLIFIPSYVADDKYRALLSLKP